MRAIRSRTPSWLRSDILLPLLAAYFAFSAYYVWQAWRREVPSIFTDEQHAPPRAVTAHTARVRT